MAEPMTETATIQQPAHRVGRSSLSVETKLWSVKLLKGERQITATGHFTMVEVDKDHRPIPVRDGTTAEVTPFNEKGD